MKALNERLSKANNDTSRLPKSFPQSSQSSSSKHHHQHHPHHSPHQFGSHSHFHPHQQIMFSPPAIPLPSPPSLSTNTGNQSGIQTPSASTSTSSLISPSMSTSLNDTEIINIDEAQQP